MMVSISKAEVEALIWTEGKGEVKGESEGSGHYKTDSGGLVVGLYKQGEIFTGPFLRETRPIGRI